MPVVAVATEKISIAGPLTNIPQPLQDEAANKAALSVATTQVAITAPQLSPGQQPFALDVHGQAWTADRPCMQIESDSGEASLRFINKTDNTAWHIGSSFTGGIKNFFIWNQNQGVVVTIRDDGTVTMGGSLEVDALKANGVVKLNGDTISIFGMKEVPQTPNPLALRSVVIDPLTGQLYYQ